MGKIAAVKSTLVVALVGAIVMSCCLPNQASATPAADGCAPAPQLEEIDCSSEKDAKIKAKCQAECEPEYQKFKDEGQKKADTAHSACVSASKCGGLADSMKPGSEDSQQMKMKQAQASKKAANSCFAEKAKQNEVVSEAGKECKAVMKKCQGLTGQNQKAVKKNEKTCSKAEKDGKDSSKDQQAKADQSKADADKNGDNAKKEDGGMPQMPQIPQMPQQQQDPQSSAPEFSTGTSANSSTSTDGSGASSTEPGTVETSKLDNGGPGAGGTHAPGGVSFGADATTNTSTTTSPGGPGYGSAGSSPGSSPGAGGGYGSSNGSSPLGSAGSGSGGYGGMSGGSGGGSGGGTGAQNTTGASATGALEKPAGDSPFEVSGGGGGKLGAPKGYKSGGDGDSVIADSAKDNFKADIGNTDPARNPASEANATEDENEAGFTVFKMVRARYLELKKRGSI